MCRYVVVGTSWGLCGKVSHEAAHMTLAQHHTEIGVEYVWFRTSVDLHELSLSQDLYPHTVFACPGFNSRICKGDF